MTMSITALVYFGIAVGVAEVGGFILGVFSGRWQHCGATAYIAASAVYIGWLTGFPPVPCILIATALLVGSLYGTIVTNRNRPAPQIVFAMPILTLVAALADLVAGSVLIMLHFGN
jgi:hypothetical protein